MGFGFFRHMKTLLKTITVLVWKYFLFMFHIAVAHESHSNLLNILSNVFQLLHCIELHPLDFEANSANQMEKKINEKK